MPETVATSHDGARPLLVEATPGLERARRAGAVAMLLLPGIATVYLSFSTGGYGVVPIAVGIVVLVLALGLHAVLAARPFEGRSRGLLLAAGALGAYAAWTLLSALWSGAPVRALAEFDRVFLYLLTLLVFGALARDGGRLRVMLWSLAAGMAIVCVAALLTRLAPDVFPTPANLADNARLSFPLTYWNSLGLIAATAIVLCLHLASSEREPQVAQLLGAAAVPPLVATLVLTFSRGALLALGVGLVAYAALGRPRGLVSALLAVTFAAVPVVLAAYGAELLAAENPTSPAAVAQGHGLALVVVAAGAGAALLRALLRSVLDPRVGRLRLSRRAVVGMAVAAVVAAAALAVVVQVPQRIAGQYATLTKSEAFTGEGAATAAGGSRLTQAGNSQRPFFWKVAVSSFVASPLLGEGAGTYELAWNRERPAPLTILDAHSVYLEALGELGFVGGALLLTGIVTVLAGSARRVRSADRALYAVVFAASLGWALRAAIDWDWEMPAVSLWVFAAGGMALAASHRGGGPELRPLARGAIVTALALVAVLPVTLVLSELRVDSALAAFRADQCNVAVRTALGARGVLPLRPEPYEIIGYCDARAGRVDAAVAGMEEAIGLDPENWRYHYGLALVRAADGQDPRPALEDARALNPESVLVRSAQARFEAAAEDPERLRSAAAASFLPPDLRPLPE